ANPLHARNAADWSLPTPSAYTDDEIATVRGWVEKGGALFLIADHMPFPGAAGELARAFGAEFSNGDARDGRWSRGRPGTFEPSAGLIESFITRGRAAGEAVTTVTTFGGSAFKPPADAVRVLVFGPKSVSLETTRGGTVTSDARKVDIDGWCQGAVFNFGQ